MVLQKALEAVHEKRLEIIPTHMERDWLFCSDDVHERSFPFIFVYRRRWLENIQDWYIVGVIQRNVVMYITFQVHLTTAVVGTSGSWISFMK